MNLRDKDSALIFDYCFGCAEQEQVSQASVLISSNPQALEFLNGIACFLERLSYLRNEKCPDRLVEMTIARLKLASIMKGKVPQGHYSSPAS